MQKVIDQGHADEASYKEKLGEHAEAYHTKIAQQDKATEDDAHKLDKEADDAKKRKEREKAAAEAHDGKPGDKDKPKGPVGTRVSMNVLGESHTLYIDEHTGAMHQVDEPQPGRCARAHVLVAGRVVNRFASLHGRTAGSAGHAPR